MQGLAQGQHESVGPIEEGRAVKRIGDGGVVQAGGTQRIDMTGLQCGRRLRQGHGGGNDGIPARAQVGAWTFIEQALPAPSQMMPETSPIMLLMQWLIC